MTGKKLHPELIYYAWARGAMAGAKVRAELFTYYIMAHYRATGNLAPGCDFRDLLAWYAVNMPAELAAVTRKS